MEKVVQDSNENFQATLKRLSSIYPSLKNDLTLRSKLEKLPRLSATPEPAQVAKLFLELDNLLSKLSPSSMSAQEKLLLLTRKIHPKLFTEMRSDRFYRSRTEDFDNLREA